MHKPLVGKCSCCCATGEATRGGLLLRHQPSANDIDGLCNNGSDDPRREADEGIGGCAQLACVADRAAMLAHLPVFHDAGACVISRPAGLFRAQCETSELLYCTKLHRCVRRIKHDRRSKSGIQAGPTSTRSVGECLCRREQGKVTSLTSIRRVQPMIWHHPLYDILAEEAQGRVAHLGP
eukprot:scaffold144430_cov32-Tisochrysis_lutea.AAC.2